MPNLLDVRKKLWDYLKTEGIEITVAQHEAIKAMMTEYATTKAELLQTEMDKMLNAAKNRKEESRKRHEAMRLKRQKQFEEREARRKAAHAGGGEAAQSPHL